MLKDRSLHGTWFLQWGHSICKRTLGGQRELWPQSAVSLEVRERGRRPLGFHEHSAQPSWRQLENRLTGLPNRWWVSAQHERWVPRPRPGRAKRTALPSRTQSPDRLVGVNVGSRMRRAGGLGRQIRGVNSWQACPACPPWKVQFLVTRTFVCVRQSSAFPTGLLRDFSDGRDGDGSLTKRVGQIANLWNDRITI